MPYFIWIMAIWFIILNAVFSFSSVICKWYGKDTEKSKLSSHKDKIRRWKYLTHKNKTGESGYEQVFLPKME